MKQAFLLLLTMVIGLTSRSQYADGFVVRISGDTIQGSIKVQEEAKYSSGVVLKFREEEKSFDASSISAFGFTTGDYYRLCVYTDPQTFESKKVFAKILVRGPLKLYTFRQDLLQFFLVQDENDSTHYLSNDLKTNNGEIIEKGTYLSKLNFLSVACRDLQSTVERVNFRENEIVWYIADLNKCKYPSDTTEILYTKARFERTIIGYVAGLPLGERWEFTGQIILRFSTPSISKSTSLNVGLGFWYLNERSEMRFGKEWDHITQYVGIPLTIQQNFGKGAVQPYIYAGVGLAYIREKSVYIDLQGGYKSKFVATVGGGLGVEASVGKRVGIRADWRYELILHYPVIGITYKL